MYIQLQEKKRKKLFKIAYYTLLQFSILSLGIFVGCWVTVNGSLQSLELKDPQIVAIRDTGISFTILFAISFILTIVSYLFYNSNGSILVNISKKNPNLSANANDLPKKVDNSLTANNKKDDTKLLTASERKEIKEVNEILKGLEFKTNKEEDIKDPSIKRIVSPSNEVKQLSSSSLKPVQQVSTSNKILLNSTPAKNQLISTPVSRTVVPVSKNVVAPTLNKPISATNSSNTQVNRLTTSVNPGAKTVIRPVSVSTTAPKKVVPNGSKPVVGQTIVRTATPQRPTATINPAVKTAPKTVYSTYRTVSPTTRKVAPMPNKSIYKVQKN